MQSKYFSLSEFKCKCGKPTCDALTEPDASLVAKLDSLREACGFPLVVDSGIRCKAYNAEVGGVSDSAHTEGKAADIAAPDSTERYFMLLHGVTLFTRLGVGKTFIHYDVANQPAVNVCWTYYP